MVSFSAGLHAQRSGKKRHRIVVDNGGGGGGGVGGGEGYASFLAWHKDFVRWKHRGLDSGGRQARAIGLSLTPRLPTPSAPTHQPTRNPPTLRGLTSPFSSLPPPSDRSDKKRKRKKKKRKKDDDRAKVSQ